MTTSVAVLQSLVTAEVSVVVGLALEVLVSSSISPRHLIASLKPVRVNRGALCNRNWYFVLFKDVFWYDGKFSQSFVGSFPTIKTHAFVAVTAKYTTTRFASPPHVLSVWSSYNTLQSDHEYMKSTSSKHPRQWTDLFQRSHDLNHVKLSVTFQILQEITVLSQIRSTLKYTLCD